MSILSILEIASLLACFFLCLAAAVTDFLRNEIPNVITFPGILAGALITLIMQEEALPRIILFLFLLLFLIGPVLFSEGDIKLSMMAVMLTGIFPFLYSFLISQLLILFTSILVWPRKTLRVFTVLFSSPKGFLKDPLCAGNLSFPFAPVFFISYSAVILFGRFLWVIL